MDENPRPARPASARKYASRSRSSGAETGHPIPRLPRRAARPARRRSVDVSGREPQRPRTFHAGTRSAEEFALGTRRESPNALNKTDAQARFPAWLRRGRPSNQPFTEMPGALPRMPLDARRPELCGPPKRRQATKKFLGIISASKETMASQKAASSPHPVPCIECASGLMRLRFLTYFTWLNEELITVPNFPAWVCDVCGRREYDEKAVSWLSMILDPNAGQPTPRRRVAPRSRPSLDRPRPTSDQT